MVAHLLRTVVLTAAAGTAFTGLAPAAASDTGVQVFPGMEIRQGSTVCTLGFIDPVARIGYSAGHCRGNGTVTDRDGRPVGVVVVARDNTPNGAVVRTDEVITDYETIALAKDVTVNPVLPGGRPLRVDPGFVLQDGSHPGRNLGRPRGIQKQQAAAARQHVFYGAGLLMAGGKAHHRLAQVGREPAIRPGQGLHHGRLGSIGRQT